MTIKLNLLSLSITLLIGLLVATVIFYLSDQGMIGKITILDGLIGSKNGYSAVFLSNGQVFFGEITSGFDSDQITLKNIFYLRQASLLSEGNQNSKIELIKRGKELHGPTDQMMINQDNILFIQTVGDESVVGKAIKQTNSGNVGTTPSLAPSQTPNIATKFIRVIDNDVGFLRVRKESSSSSEEVGRVNPGTSFKVLQEIADWYQIEFEAGKIGWVSKAFVVEVK